MREEFEAITGKITTAACWLIQRFIPPVTLMVSICSFLIAICVSGLLVYEAATGNNMPKEAAPAVIASFLMVVVTETIRKICLAENEAENKPNVSQNSTDTSITP